MNKTSRFLVIFLLGVIPLISSGKEIPGIKFTVSMENPSTRRFHVTMNCKGFDSSDNLFKIPNWTPGYYWIMNYSRNILDFKVSDMDGGNIPFEKEGKNGWRIALNGQDEFKIDYDVYAVNVSVAEPFLDRGRGFISPTAVFLYPEGHLESEVEVSIIPFSDWEKVSTGLDPVIGKMNTFYAGNYDILYDCPILCGNQEVREFEVEGIPHTIAMEKPGNSDLDMFITDLQKVIKTTFNLMGDIPYSHYTFLIMDQGMGGLEHSNSMAVFTRGDIYDPAKPSGYKGWMNFITHEFFHLYNIKSIRPVELGPFDYDSENYTKMLWVSEGFTVYYEYIIMNRAGLLTPEEVLGYLSQNIRNYENVPGSRFQSATASSYDTWINFFNRSGNSANSTISYYDKGCALGMLLDIAIRRNSYGSSSLDDVMRYLYNEYYLKEKRGFTEAEFRKTCESFAGTSLSEIFDVYASTTAPVDYKKYLGFAALLIDTEPEALPGAWIGATTRLNGKILTVTSVEYDSPAWRGGLGESDRIIMVDGTEPDGMTLEKLLEGKAPGDTINLLAETRGLERNLSIVAGSRMVIPFTITPDEEAGQQQKELYRSWLSEKPGGTIAGGGDYPVNIPHDLNGDSELIYSPLFMINPVTNTKK